MLCPIPSTHGTGVHAVPVPGDDDQLRRTRCEGLYHGPSLAERALQRSSPPDPACADMPGLVSSSDPATQTDELVAKLREEVRMGRKARPELGLPVGGCGVQMRGVREVEWRPSCVFMTDRCPLLCRLRHCASESRNRFATTPKPMHLLASYDLSSNTHSDHLTAHFLSPYLPPSTATRNHSLRSASHYSISPSSLCISGPSMPNDPALGKRRRHGAWRASWLRRLCAARCSRLRFEACRRS